MFFYHMRFFYLSVILFINPVCQVLKAQDAVRENNLKAVMIYNFTKFMQWPQEDTIDEFYILVMEGSDIIHPLKNIAEKRDFRGKKIIVQEIDNADKIKDCCIVVLSENNINTLSSILAKAVESNILVIGNEEGLAEKGAAVNFVKRNEKIRFEINISTLKKTKIETNTQLLNLAVKLYNRRE